MDQIPQRRDIIKIYRKFLDKIEERIFLPFKNPNVYQVSSILLSSLFLLNPQIVYAMSLLFVILVLNTLEISAAQRFNKNNKQNWMIDITCDRLSEGLIFAPILDTIAGKVFFAFYLVNIVTSLYSIRYRIQTTFSLRLFYLIFLIIKYLSL